MKRSIERIATNSFCLLNEGKYVTVDPTPQREKVKESRYINRSQQTIEPSPQKRKFLNKRIEQKTK